MKKMILFVVCLMMMGIQSVKAQTRVIRNHNGEVTFFTANKLQEAIDASEDGDTLYLNEGEFSGGITVSKDISIIGYGDSKSKINGDITVSIAGKITQAIEGLYISGNLSTSKASKGLTVRKCYVYGRISFGNVTEEARIDRCKCTSIYLSSNIVSLLVNNSEISSLNYKGPGTDKVEFLNCYIGTENSDCASFLNCCIGSFDGYYTYYSSAFVNCLIYVNSAGMSTNPDKYKEGENYGCWTTNISLSDVDKFKEKGYLGTDGTVVGQYGGETPFTLTTSSPKITGYSSTVDPSTHKVIVNLKVKNQ